MVFKIQMEFKELILIIKKGIKTIIFLVVVFLLAAYIFYVFQPAAQKVSLNINVTRAGVQETSDYRYDDFYRLQADERFSDTLVRWLGSPRIAADILEAAGIEWRNMSERKLSKFFEAKRFSSNYIAVNFVAVDSQKARKISDSINFVLNREIAKLDEKQKEAGWFLVLVDSPLITNAKISLLVLLSGACLLAIFFGIWAAFVKNYLAKN